MAQNELQKLEDLLNCGFIFKEDYEARKAELLEKYEQDMDLQQSGGYGSGSSLHSSGAIPHSTDIPVLSSVEYTEKPSFEHLQALTERNKKSRNIKLFVSSTFKDMQQERNLLIKKVFPEIKRVCAKRKVNFVYVDFRWGITSEESSGGKVISLCLNEIDNCRPYMIGMLGERYGWTQNRAIMDKVLQQSFEEAQEIHPWLASYTDRSVTELEMLYGSLFYPELSTNSLFYLRDPEYLHGIDIIERKNYEPESEYERAKLLDLKARIKYSKLPCKDYRTPEQVADQIMKDLTAMIERDYPLNEAEEFDAIDRELSAQYEIALAKADVYIGKPYYFSTIESHLNAATSTPLVITGPSGAGKTSLISSWWIEHKKKNLDDGLVVDFIGVLHNDVNTVLRYILGSLKKQFAISKDIPSNPDELLHSLSEWLALSTGKGRTVIVLDGLDQIEDKGKNLQWLPGLFPNNVRVIVSVSSDSSMYDTCARKGWDSLLSLDPLKNPEKRQLIELFLNRFSKKLSHEQIFHLVDSKQTSNPLFLVAVLDQLRVFGQFEQLTLFIVDLLRARDLTSLFKDKIFVQWEKDFTPQFVKDVLCLIYSSNNGLLESELSSITNVPQQSIWSSFVDAAKDALVDTAGLLSIAHQSVIQAIKEKYLTEHATEVHYHRLVANYFNEKSLTPRKVSEYPMHLMFINDEERMKNFLLDINVFKMIYNDFTKYQLLKYWQMTKALADAPTLYLNALKSLQNSQPAEYALLSYKVANFLRDSGSPSKALMVFESAHMIFKSTFGERSTEYANFLYDYAALMTEQASYDSAISIADKTKALRIQLYGNDHPMTAQVIWLIALINKKRGNFAAAISAYQKAIEITERFYGPSNPTLGLYMQTLADIYRKQASYDNAEQLYVKALDINRHAYGEMHPNVAENLDSLGRVLKKKGEYEKAKPLYLQALDIVEKVYGPDHIKIAYICTDLADVERKLGKSTTAYELYQRSLALNKKEFGELHPEVAENLNSLGLIEKHRGEYDQAIQHIKQAIEIIEQIFDPDHNKIASFANNLADVYSIQAKYVAATELYKRALRLNEKYLGADHPEVSENLNALGMIAKKRGRYDEAEAFYSRSLAIIEKVYGSEHPKVALYVHNLGVVYRKLKLWDKSWAAYERALNINKKLFGEAHELVAGNMNGLAIVLGQSRRDLDKAVELHSRALAIFEKNFGKEHEKVALTLNYLAEAYRKQGRYDYEGPEKLYLRALDINRRLFGEEHPEVAENLNGLAQVYKNQFNYTKAEPMFKKAIEISERTLGNHHPHVLNRYKNLADLYERQGRVDQAQKYQAKLAQLKQEQEKMLNQ